MTKAQREAAKRRRRQNPARNGLLEELLGFVRDAFDYGQAKPGQPGTGQVLNPTEFELYKELMNAGRKVCLARYHPDNKASGNREKYLALDALCQKVMLWK